MSDLNSASTAEIQIELFERGLVAVPLDWLTDHHRHRLIEHNRQAAKRDFRHAEALERFGAT
jgi:hypothetical protein